MDYAEEQRNELDALSQIYYNEIEIISDVAPIAFSIKIKPQVSSYYESQTQPIEDELDSDASSSEQEPLNIPQNFSIELLFELPSKYPDERPHIKVKNSSCLEKNELDSLIDRLYRRAQESLGTMMIFLLVNDVVEWLSNKSDDDVQEIELEKEKILEEKSGRDEKKIVEGTPVTELTFLTWKAKFDAELLKSSLARQKLLAEQGAAGSNRLTGREMFETDKTLVESDLNFVEDLDQGQLEALMQNLDQFELDGSDIALSDEECDEDEDEDEDEEEEDEDYADSTDEETRDKSAGACKLSRG